MLGILSLAAFASHDTTLANQLGVSAQAELYHKSESSEDYQEAARA